MRTGSNKSTQNTQPMGLWKGVTIGILMVLIPFFTYQTFATYNKSNWWEQIRPLLDPYISKLKAPPILETTDTSTQNNKMVLSPVVNHYEKRANMKVIVPSSSIPSIMNSSIKIDQQIVGKKNNNDKDVVGKQHMKKILALLEGKADEELIDKRINKVSAKGATSQQPREDHSTEKVVNNETLSESDGKNRKKMKRNNKSHDMLKRIEERAKRLNESNHDGKQSNDEDEKQLTTDKNIKPKKVKDVYTKGHHYKQNITKDPLFSCDKIPLEIQRKYQLNALPTLGSIPINGTVPLFDFKHQGHDAIFALACGYPMLYYQRFVGSLRKVGYTGDLVLAVSTVDKMKPGVEEYLRSTHVLAYPFEVDCLGPDNCKFSDDFLGYPDPRPHRSFANIRYALYEYWLRYYQERSYVLILDFRDTFFQEDPFKTFGPIMQRPVKYELQLFAENYEVKNIGICVYNSMWVGRCFGKDALKELKSKAVICSGSTLGSYPAIYHYIRTMLQSMDTVKCWLKGIESDQGYQNYLYYNGHFNTINGNATLFYQGHGVVNTIGAMNGFRVPKEKKGPLDTFWKTRDSNGYIINYDGNRSACVHQWDRWYMELHNFIDKKLF